jgi:lactosylceramide 4-alpha-galactosyltransferase
MTTPLYSKCFIAVCLLAIFGYIYTVFYQTSDIRLRPMEVETKTTTDTKAAYNIIFIESNEHGTYLTDRQLCSIESAAKHNPTAQVLVKSLKAQIKYDELFQKYPNIKLETIKIEDAIKNTPLENWWKNNHMSNDPYTRISHTSDGLRYALLYKHGGIYADLDTITLKSLEPLVQYSGGFPFEDDQYVTGSVIVSQKNHPFMRILMEQFTRRYDGEAHIAITLDYQV